MATKKPKLTVKEQKLIKGVAAGKSQTQAAIEAGYSPRSAHELASKTLKKVDVQNALHMELEKQGITLDRVIKPISDALDAEKVHIVGNGDQAMADVVPDHAIRLKASGMAQTLMGINKETNQGNTYNFVQIVQDQKDKYGI